MKHVIIIGCGFAGAAAAVACAQAGVRVTVLEATDRLGGRASSFHDGDTGVELDNGQHLLIGAYHNTLALLKTLGTMHLVTSQPRFGVTFIHPGGTRTSLRALSMLPGRSGLLAGIVLTNHLAFRDRIRLLQALLRLRRMNTGACAQFTITELLQQLQQSDTLVARFWRPFVLAVMNNTPDRAAASLLVEVVHRVFFGSRDDARLMFPAAGLSALLSPLKEVLSSHGGELRLQTAVDMLSHTGGILQGVRVQNGETILADAVICAVPAHRAAKLLPDSMCTAIDVTRLETFEYSPIVTCYCMLERPVMTEAFLGSTSTSLQWIFNRSMMLRSVDSGQELALVVSADPSIAELPMGELQALLLHELQTLLPASQSVRVRWMKVIKEKRATFVCTPQMESARPAAETKVNNFFLAGDWTRTSLPATIEGAAISGNTAAIAALSYLNQNDQ